MDLEHQCDEDGLGLGAYGERRGRRKTDKCEAQVEEELAKETEK